MTKEELLAEAALILEQEGWLAGRFAHDNQSTRLRRFADRYKQWQDRVNEFRKRNPEAWEEPPDNS